MAVRRILYLNHGARVSGAEMSLLHLLRGLDRERFEPLVVLPEGGRYLDLLRSHQIPVEVHPLEQVAATRPDRVVRVTVTLLRLAARHRVSLIHANSFYAAKMALFAAKVSGIPLVASVRDIIPFAFMTRQALLACDRVLCVSQATATNLLQGRPAPRVQVVYNGVDVAGFRPRPVAEAATGLDLDPPLRRPVVGIVAPLVPWKGHRVFLQAVGLVARITTLGTALVVGDEAFSGPAYVRELFLLADSVCPPGVVRFLGFREDVPRLLGEMDVVVCPSVEPDPFPRALLEAMAAARPVVGAAHGGIPEALTDGVTGLLARPGDVEDTAAKIVRFLDEPGLARRMGEEAAREVARRFSLERHCEAVAAVYDSLLAAGPARAAGRRGG